MIHHYHFQVFALSATLPDDTGVTWETLLPQIKPHIIAGGEAVATYEKK